MHRTASNWGHRTALAVSLSLLGVPQQHALCPGTSLTTRAEVEACLATLDGPAASGSQNARRLADRLRQRLRDGDFRTGERIFLHVAGDSTLTDTLTVLPGPEVQVPGLGSVTLAGVLRGDLAAYFTDALGQYLKDPTVEARALIRLSVVGEVGKPGFYAVPSEAALADVLMLAGGLTQDAKPKAMRVDRDGRGLWDAARVRDALAQGQTVDDLGLREGDRIVVPGSGRSLDTVLRVAAVLLAGAAVWGAAR